MDEYFNGKEHQKIYDGFMSLLQWSAGAVILLLVLMAIFLI